MSLRAALISAYDSTMETFTLVVWFFWGSDMQVVRTVGLTQAECIAKLEEVLATGASVCDLPSVVVPAASFLAWPHLVAPMCADCRTIKERRRAPA